MGMFQEDWTLCYNRYHEFLNSAVTTEEAAKKAAKEEENEKRW